MLRTHLTCTLLCLAVLSGASGLANADDVDEVMRLDQSGQTEQALARAERFLAGKPGDAAMRFQKGVLLGALGRKDEAIELFTQLSQDYPDLPEPYNNLGVLLAARGEYDRARIAFETAIRNNPGFAVAHENLGDIHAALAGRSYARAGQLEPGNASVPPKLVLIRQLLARTAASTSSSAAHRSPAS